ncbi:hypothetical protein BJX61DRAFT_539357 [Aspergillus egyptiacus]|nr:hypothetical protein BJX61DRAFT_539357 [Aspergillus egyptiacus]
MSVVAGVTDGSRPPPPGSFPSQATPKEQAERPWKYIGSPGYVDFLALESDLCNFRRFDRLNIRVILGLQDDVRKKEMELDSLDRRFMARGMFEKHHNGSFAHDGRGKRQRCLKELRRSLIEYNRFLYYYTPLRALPNPNKRAVENLKIWHENYGGRAIEEAEWQYVNASDLVCLVPTVVSPLRQLFERSSRFLRWKWWQKESSEDILPRYHAPEVVKANDQRIDVFVTAATMVLGAGLIIAPLWTLAHVVSRIVKLGIITAFSLVFLGLVSFGTSARPIEALGATAA